MQTVADAGTVPAMNPGLISGLQAFNAAAARMEKAADRLARVPASTIPAASPPDATPPPATAATSVVPPPPAGSGGRAPLSHADSLIDAQVDMIRAHQQAALAATSIRAADDSVGALLDTRA